MKFKIRVDRFFLTICVNFVCQKDHMYAERGPRVTHVNTRSIITLQNIVPDVRYESRKKNLVSYLRTCDYSNKMCALYYHSL